MLTVYMDEWLAKVKIGPAIMADLTGCVGTVDEFSEDLPVHKENLKAGLPAQKGIRLLDCRRLSVNDLVGSTDASKTLDLMTLGGLDVYM
jgi:hypothetical protein